MTRPPVQWRAMFRAVLAEGRASNSRLAFFTGALAVGVAAVVGVAALVGAFEAGLRAESRTLLGGDLRAEARRALPDAFDGAFDDVPHRVADLRELAAAATVGERSRLCDLKVTSGAYPFAGELELQPASVDSRALSAEDALAAPELAADLGLAIGDSFDVGGVPFRLRALVLEEPDRVDFAFTRGPRLILSEAGFARTGLGDKRSFVTYARVWSFDEDLPAGRLAELERELTGRDPDADWVRVQNHTEAQPQIRRAVGRVEDFLGLVALLSLLLGGIGVAQIVRAWLAGRARAVAVLRSLGLRAREISVIYLGHVFVLAAFGSIVGAVFGVVVPFVVQSLAPDLFAGSFTTLVQPQAALRGVLLGIGVAILFSLPSLTAVWRVPPSSVLRADAAPLSPPRWVRFGAPLILAAGLLVVARIQGGGWTESGGFVGGVSVLTGLLWAGARSISALAARVDRGKRGPYFKHGLAALARPGAGTTGAIVALGLGVMVVSSMWVIERELRRSFAEALPEDAPSLFLVDIQPEQWDGVRAELEAVGSNAIDSNPVVMGRFRKLDGRPVDEIARERRKQGREAWMLSGERRLTWQSELAADNEVVEGELWSDPDAWELSLEESYAERLGVGIGSTVTLDIQGVPIELLVTSIRTVDWEGFGINFFMIVEPGALDDAPHFRLAVARVEPEERELALQTTLSNGYPNVTVLRVRPLLEKLASVFARVSSGVRGLGSFTILTGLVILAGAVASSALRRSREAALLKCLGVTRGGVLRLFVVEYALVGLVSGVIGSIGAVALAWAFLNHVAEVESAPALLAVPMATLATGILSVLAGSAASSRPLSTPPLATLRG